MSFASDIPGRGQDPAGPPPEGWLVRLRKASFRGIPFFTRRNDLEVGRRQDVHEYNDRDDPHTQDLGRRARRYRIEAFVVGPNYDLQRDALIRALEKGGPGQLVTERFGTKRVSILRGRIQEESTEGRWSLISIDAVESGINLQPRSIVSHFDAVLDAIEKTSESVLVQYVLNFPADPGGWVRGEVERLASAVVDNLGDQGLKNLRDSPEGARIRQRGELLKAANGSDPAIDLDLSAGDGAELGNELIELHTEIGKLEAPTATERFRELKTLAPPELPTDPVPGNLDSAFFQRRLEVVLIPGAHPIPPDLQAAFDLFTATNRLRSRSIVIARVHAAQALSFASADETERIRDDLIEQLDVEIAVAGANQEDEPYLELRDLRAAVLIDFSERALLLPELVTFTPPTTTSALLLSQRLYGTGEREDELETRLAPASPGFIPGAVAVRVLAE
ncbi:MAG: DNA circularization N-terminal domain-containing protein [Vicinamibacteria bacterium]